MNFQFVKSRVKRSINKHLGIIDIGSNSVRLVIYRYKGNYIFPVFNERVNCKLGEGLDNRSRLKIKRMNFALVVLKRYAKIMNNMKLNKKLIFATAAVRRAKNGNEFKNTAEKILQSPISVLSAEEEAKLVSLGITANMKNINGLITDLGGGSVELILVENSIIKKLVSLDIGHLSEKTDLEIKKKLRKVHWLEEAKNSILYGVGGSFRALGTAYLQQTNYPLHVIHGLTIKKQDSLNLLKKISLKKNDQIGVPLGRKLTMPMASKIIKNIIQISKVSELMISGTSVRDGFVAKLNDNNFQINNDNLLSICYEISKETERFKGLNKSMIKLLAPVNKFLNKGNDKNLFQAACLLSDISWNEHPDLRGTLAIDRILALSIFSISHKERAWLAKAIYHRYVGIKENKPKLPKFGRLISKNDKKTALAIGLGLRFGHVFCAGMNDFLLEIKLQINDNKLICNINPKSQDLMDEQSKRRFKLFARSCDLQPEISFYN